LNTPLSMPDALQLDLPLGEIIGEGTSGVVAPLLKSADGGRYAVKRLKHGAPSKALEHEVRLLKLCSAECCDIVRYAFACETAAEFVLIFEACDAELWDALTGGWPHGHVDAGDRRRWSLQLCRAVAHCHDLGVLHRDVNPWNVLLVMEGTCPTRANARLGDFGLAVSPEGDLRGWETPGAAALDASATGSLYSAPELGDVYSFPADVFSLGMTLLAIWNSADLSEEQLIDLIEGVKNAASSAQRCELGCLSQAGATLRAGLAAAVAPQPPQRPSAAELRQCVEAAGSNYEQVRAMFKMHTWKLGHELGKEDLMTVLESLGPKDAGDSLVTAVFAALANTAGRISVDSFLQWVFLDELAVR